MRSRVAHAVLRTVGLALAIFVVPLGVVAVVLVVGVSRQGLEHDALAAALTVGPSVAAGDPVEPGGSGGSTVGVYGLDGQRLSGSGPARWDPTTARAASGSLISGSAGGDMVTAEPVTSNESVIAVVRASRSWAAIVGSAVAACLAILGAAAVVLAVAAIVARRTGASLGTPVEELAATAAALGHGAGRSTPDATGRGSGIAEVDLVRGELTRTSRRLDELIDRERRVAANASHQLRTPLTGMRARLETALGHPSAIPDAVGDAIATIDRLDRTIDEVLALTRGATSDAAPVPLAPLVEHAVERWRADYARVGRPVRAELEVDAPGPRTLVDTALDVLLDNALRHGRGAATVRLRDAVGATAIDVEDEGAFEPPGDLFAEPSARAPGSGGLGLGIAARAAADHGARLLLTRTVPHTRFTLLLPERPRDL